MHLAFIAGIRIGESVERMQMKASSSLKFANVFDELFNFLLKKKTINHKIYSFSISQKKQ